MKQEFIFNLKSDLSRVSIPLKLNNPFGEYVPEIAQIAAKEFQAFIEQEAKNWSYDFHTQKGKMWGILVVQKNDGAYGYLGTVSGKLPDNIQCDHLVPSMFEDTTGEVFLNKGMTHLTDIGNQIKASTSPKEIATLKEERRLKSMALQQRIFENYNFLNLSGKKENLLKIFSASNHGYPPVAAGECAAPKLLQYAIKNDLKPIALTEFWWGSSIVNKEKEHASFYPACKDRCRPILEYILEDKDLFFNSAESV